MECDLPCEEVVFDEPDPFTHSKFRFRRDLTSRMAFCALLNSARSPARELDITVLDSFVLIHREGARLQLSRKKRSKQR
jgi:hypothetical protein